MKTLNRIKQALLKSIPAGLILLPIVITGLWSLSARWAWPDLIPSRFSLYGWKAFVVSNDAKLLPYSIFLSLLVTVLTLAISVPAAKALTYPFPGKSLVEVLVFLPIIVPTAAIAMGVHVNFLRLNLAYTMGGVVLMQIFPCLPYGIRIMHSVYEVLGDGWEKQGRILGATRWQTFMRVTLPLLTPGLLASFSMIFIVSFSQYFLTVLIGGGVIETFTTRMFPYLYSGNRTLASVYTGVFNLVSITVLVIVNRLTHKLYAERFKEFYYV